MEGLSDHRWMPALQGGLKGGQWPNFCAWLQGAVLWLHMERTGRYCSAVVLLRQRILNHGISLPVCKTCAHIHQTNELRGTPAWLLPADVSARCWDGAVGPEDRRCQENIPCSEGRAGSTVICSWRKWWVKVGVGVDKRLEGVYHLQQGWLTRR